MSAEGATQNTRPKRLESCRPFGPRLHVEDNPRPHGRDRDFANLFYDLSGTHPASLADARKEGVPVIAYGAFINDVIGFVIIAFVVFLIIRQINKRKQAEAAPATKDCPHCLSAIPLAATRCSGCCSEVAGCVRLPES